MLPLNGDLHPRSLQQRRLGALPERVCMTLQAAVQAVRYDLSAQMKMPLRYLCRYQWMEHADARGSWAVREDPGSPFLGQANPAGYALDMQAALNLRGSPLSVYTNW